MEPRCKMLVADESAHLFRGGGWASGHCSGPELRAAGLTRLL
jgi:hypothetical protein